MKTHAHMNTYLHIHITHTYTYMYGCMHIRTNMHGHMKAHTVISTHIHMHICMHAWTRVHVNICPQAHLNAHTCTLVGCWIVLFRYYTNLFSLHLYQRYFLSVSLSPYSFSISLCLWAPPVFSPLVSVFFPIFMSLSLLLPHCLSLAPHYQFPSSASNRTITPEG